MWVHYQIDILLKLSCLCTSRISFILLKKSSSLSSNVVCPGNPLRIVSLACVDSSIFPLVRCHLCLEHLIECSGCLPNVVDLVTEHRWFRARRICHSLPRINSSDGFTPFSSQIRNLFFLSVHPPAHGS